MSGLKVLEPTSIQFTRNLGVSDSSNEIWEDTEKIRTHFAESVTFNPILQILEGLLKAREDSSMDNWDGYGAKATDTNSFRYAIHFALSLPWDIPIPDIYINPEGYVTYEWYEGKRNVYSVITGNRGELAYAGLYGSSKVYGTEYMYEEIPETIINNIYRLYLE